MELDEQERQAKQFCYRFLLILVAVLTATAAMNVVVNPFAQYPFRCLSPVVQMSRVDKLRLLSELPSPPSGIILGSSRVLKLEPAYLQDKTGLSFFNAGVNYAVPTDHLAWYRHYLATYGNAPRMVVLGLDISSFSPSVATDARLISNPTLSRHVRSDMTVHDRCARWTELLSWQQTRESLRSLKHHFLRQADVTSPPLPVEKYQHDGQIVYLQREREIAAGTYDFAGPLEFNKHEYETRYRQFDQLSETRLNEFRQLARECTAHGTQLISFITPMHPSLLQHLSARSRLTARRSELVRCLQAYADELGFTLVDLTELESFGADPRMFVDGIHPLEPNTRKLIDKILTAYGSNNQHERVENGVVSDAV